MNGRADSPCSHKPAFIATSSLGWGRVVMMLACVLVASQTLVDQPAADAQGLFQRMLRGRSAPQVRQTPVPTRPQYVPQRTQVPRQTQVVPKQIQPQQQDQTNQQTQPQAQLQASMRLYQVQPQVTRVDPRTGRRVTSNTGQIVTVAVDPGTGRGYVIDPNTRQRMVIDPRTGTTVAATASGLQQTITIDPRTGRMTATNEPATVSGSSSTGPNGPPTPSIAVDRDASTIGIRVVRSDDTKPSLEVTGFLPHSLADEAGLKVGDRIYSINNEPTPDISALASVVRTMRAGSSVKLQVGRGEGVDTVEVPIVAKPSVASLGSPKTAAPTVAQTPKPPAMTTQSAKPVSGRSLADQAIKGSRLGIEVQEQPGTRGVLVVSVDPKSPAARAGLKVGDRIFSIDGRMIPNADGLTRELASRENGERFAVQLVRSNRLVTSQVALVSAPKPTPAKAPKKATLNESDNKAAGSLTSGVGAVLGGLFGAKEKQPAEEGSATEVSADSKPDQLSLSQPSGQPSNQPAGPRSVLVPSTQDDEMAFGDEEPIATTVFDTTPVPAKRVERSLLNDPPSTSKLAPPKKSEPEIEAPKSISELEAEIKRLKAQLEKAGK